MPDDYNPVQCLQDEVRRFQATNAFNPMQVTVFYIQAAVVLNYVRDLEERLDILTRVAAHVYDHRKDDNLNDLVFGMGGVVKHAQRMHRYPAPVEKPK